MKRYPKRARPLWGRAKRRPWAPTGVSLTFGPGTYVEGDVYTFTSTRTGAAPIAFGCAVGGEREHARARRRRADGTTPVHESGPRVSADGMAVGHAFADGIVAGVVLSHGGPLAAPVALAIEQASEEEALAVRLRIAEQAAGLPVGALRDEADLRRALAGGSFPASAAQGDPTP